MSVSNRIALIGNPNSGKTTLFNQLTGANQRVGNWAGVTVERKEGQFEYQHQQFNLVDLPGVYSLTTLSEDSALDEQIACRFLLSTPCDLVINVVDASNLEAGLYLTLQLLERNLPVIIALNMLDIAKLQNIDIDLPALSKKLGVPVVPLISKKGKGVDKLKQTIAEQIQAQAQHTLIKEDVTSGSSQNLLPRYSPEIDTLVDDYLSIFKKYDSSHALFAIAKRGFALQLLEADVFLNRFISQHIEKEQDQTLAKEWETFQTKSNALSEQEDLALTIADYRYQYIASLVESTIDNKQVIAHQLTEKLDKIFLHRWFGLPIFFLIMYLMFLFSINLGGALQPLFDLSSVAIFVEGTQWLGYQLHFPEWLTLILAQGIGGGVNTIMPLIPQIALMFLFLSFLEDSGYMARAAFVVDRLMQFLGLPGKSFVPLIVGFGCNVPAVMGARTLDTNRERIVTIIMAPFMSCGARLAIFVVFAAAFFGKQSALIVFSLYLLGIFVAILTGILLKVTLLKGEATPFIMKLPIYHLPHCQSLFRQTWMRLKGFILRAGKIIILVSMFIGILSSFTFKGKEAEDLDHSMLATVSQYITPIFKPIGIDNNNWQASVGLITGMMAKEVVVGTLNSLYTAEYLRSNRFSVEEYNLLDSLGEAFAETWQSLKDTMSLSVLLNPIAAVQGDSEISGGAVGVMQQQFQSPFAAYSYLIFVLLYTPCVSVMGAIAREAGGRWMMFSAYWGIQIGYTLALLFYQITMFHQHPTFSLITITVAIMINVLFFMVLRTQSIQRYMTQSRDHN